MQGEKKTNNHLSQKNYTFVLYLEVNFTFMKEKENIDPKIFRKV